MLQLIRISQTQKLSYVKILWDSQAAILALDSKDVKSKTVERTIEALNAVADITISTRLERVKAHIGIEGNEEADKAAKEGADTSDTTHIVHTPWAVKQSKIQEFMLTYGQKDGNDSMVTNTLNCSYTTQTIRIHAIPSMVNSRFYWAQRRS